MNNKVNAVFDTVIEYLDPMGQDNDELKRRIAKAISDNSTRKICWWSAEDVKVALGWVNERRTLDKLDPIPFTEDMGDTVLDKLENRFDASYGLTWDDVEDCLIDVLDDVK